MESEELKILSQNLTENWELKMLLASPEKR